MGTKRSLNSPKTWHESCQACPAEPSPCTPFQTACAQSGGGQQRTGSTRENGHARGRRACGCPSLGEYHPTTVSACSGLNWRRHQHSCFCFMRHPVRWCLCWHDCTVARTALSAKTLRTIHPPCCQRLRPNPAGYCTCCFGTPSASAVSSTRRVAHFAFLRFFLSAVSTSPNSANDLQARTHKYTHERGIQSESSKC